MQTEAHQPFLYIRRLTNTLLRISRTFGGADQPEITRQKREAIQLDALWQLHFPCWYRPQMKLLILFNRSQGRVLHSLHASPTTQSPEYEDRQFPFVHTRTFHSWNPETSSKLNLLCFLFVTCRAAGASREKGVMRKNRFSATARRLPMSPPQAAGTWVTGSCCSQ